MKRLIFCAFAAVLGCANVGFARSVDLKTFREPNGPKGQFVLQPPQEHRDGATVVPVENADLVRAFNSLASGNPTTPVLTERNAASSIRPRYAQQRDRWLRLTNIQAPTFCGSEPYRPNPALPVTAERRRATWYPTMVTAACEAGLPPQLLDALVTQESRYNPLALSPKGAAGIAQLMPGRARLLGVRDVWNPVDNLRGGARHLRALLDEFGRFDLALAAYNAGEGRVRRTLEVPRIPETLGYVSAILMTMNNEIAGRTLHINSYQK